jgi:signal peptidase I
VEGHDGAVYVNGTRLLEPYLPLGLATEDFPAAVVPADHLWVMGDNRLDSRDSHVFGPIAESDIVGRAILKVWPPQDAAFL